MPEFMRAIPDVHPYKTRDSGRFNFRGCWWGGNRENRSLVPARAPRSFSEAGEPERGTTSLTRLEGDGGNRVSRERKRRGKPCELARSIVRQEATAGIEPAIRVLQTPALPLGHVATRLREIACRSAGRLRNGLRAGDGIRTHDLLLGKETFYR